MSNSVRTRDDHGRFAKSTDMVAIPEAEYKQWQGALGMLEAAEMRLEERLQSLDAMIDEKGWAPLYDYGKDGGLSLEQIHSSSRQLREMVAGNPFMKRGSQLRITHVWGGGQGFSVVKSDTGAPAKMSTNLRTIMSLPKNKRAIFGAAAKETLERAAFTDGMVFALGDDKKKTYQIVPITEIQGVLHNPDDSSEIWAYRRVWFRNPADPEPVVRWYYTDSFEDTGAKRKTRIKHNDNLEVIDRDHTFIDAKFNAHGGWAFGVPDGLAAIGWVRLYREFLVNGSIMSRALAQFAFRATMKSQSGAAKGSLEVGKPKGSGTTVFSSEDFAPLASAGKGYDFSSGRPLAAGIAAALEVSLISLTSDSSSAGGASNSEQTLDVPAKATASLRRLVWEDWFDRIFRHMGMVGTQEVRVTWNDLREESIQRIMQAMVLVWNTGLFDGTVMQKMVAEVMNIADPGSVPDGVLIPNNKATVEASRKPAQTPSPTAGSGQGQSTPAGQGDNDHTTDQPQN